MIRCLVIDDEPLALGILASYIQRVNTLFLVDITTSASDGLKRVKNGEIDLVFLDIQMPVLNGIDFMKLVEGNCSVILTTAYPQFAIDGFEYNVIDYLLKPFSFERFSKSIQKVPRNNESLITLKQDFIFVKSEYKLLRLELDQILYFEGLRDYVAIYLNNGTKILTLQSMGSFEKSLLTRQFVRIHKSYIVALNKIHFIERNKVVVNGNYLPIGDTYRNNFQEKIGHL